MVLVIMVIFCFSGVDPGFFLGGGALVSCATSTPINHIVFFFFLQNTSCTRKPQVISGGGVRTPSTLPPRSAPASRTPLVMDVLVLVVLVVMQISLEFVCVSKIRLQLGISPLRKQSHRFSTA